MSATQALIDPELIDGRYRLGLELGAGAFGSVYRATQVVLGRDLRDVALKLFRSDAVHEGNVVEQMNDAVALLGLLSHATDWEVRQHFVTIYDLGVTREAQPRAYLAMELVRDGSLSRRIRDFGKFTLAGTHHYLRQMVRALGFMHEHGYVHSDLKPDNVLVFRSRGRDHIKIGDFGLAGRYRGLFTNGPRGGTLSYLAPEALQGLNTTPAADVFSLGVMAFEMLTGANPFDAVGSSLTPRARQDGRRLNELQLRARREPLRVQRGDFPELRSADQAWLAPLCEIITRMLAVSPVERYASAQEVFADLEQMSGRTAPRSAPLTAAPKEPATGEDPRIAQIEFELRIGNWSAAMQTANAMIQANPESPAGYLLKSQVSLRQAAALSGSNGAAAVVQSLRRQAVSPLRAALRACPAAQDQRVIRQELAALYEQLGDHETARQYLETR